MAGWLNEMLRTNEHDDSRGSVSGNRGIGPLFPIRRLDIFHRHGVAKNLFEKKGRIDPYDSSASA